MTLSDFRQLLPAEQVRLTLKRGTYLLQRIHRAKGFHLYHLSTARTGFFVELSFDPARGAIMLVRSFEHLALLQEYVTGIRLPIDS